MDILRSRVGVAAVNGKVYVFGGYDGTIHRLSAVECYDSQVGHRTSEHFIIHNYMYSGASLLWTPLGLLFVV